MRRMQNIGSSHLKLPLFILEYRRSSECSQTIEQVLDKKQDFVPAKFKQQLIEEPYKYKQLHSKNQLFAEQIQIHHPCRLNHPTTNQTQNQPKKKTKNETNEKSNQYGKRGKNKIKRPFSKQLPKDRFPDASQSQTGSRHFQRPQINKSIQLKQMYPQRKESASSLAQIKCGSFSQTGSMNSRYSKLNEQKICQMCLSPFQKGYRVSPKCHHYFCRECILAYTKFKITHFQEVYCPFEDCKNMLNTDSKLYMMLDLKMRRKYIQLRTMTGHCRVCPRPNCMGVIELSQSPNPKYSSPLTPPSKGQKHVSPQKKLDLPCSMCGCRICGRCHQQFHEGSCQRNQLQLFQLLLNLRECGKCGLFIEKSEGCNHIKCKCGYQMCYECGMKWHKDHYCQSPPNLCFNCFPLWILFKVFFCVIYLLLMHPLLILRSVLVSILLGVLSVIVGMMLEWCDVLRDWAQWGVGYGFLGLLLFPLTLGIGIGRAFRQMYGEMGRGYWSEELMCSGCNLVKETLQEIKHRRNLSEPHSL